MGGRSCDTSQAKEDFEFTFVSKEPKVFLITQFYEGVHKVPPCPTLHPRQHLLLGRSSFLPRV